MTNDLTVPAPADLVERPEWMTCRCEACVLIRRAVEAKLDAEPHDGQVDVELLVVLTLL